MTTTLVFSQSKVADKFFDNYAYVKASKFYEEAVSKGDDSEHVLTRLGDCYYNNSNSEKAALWYGKAINKYPEVKPEYIYKYIQALRSTGKYNQANTWVTKYKSIQNDKKRAEDFDSKGKL